MRTVIFIAIFLLIAICGFTSETFAVNPVITQLGQHDADMTAEHVTLDTKLNQLLSSATPSVPQPIQREFNATSTIPDAIFEIGTFTVPPSKILVIELITVKVPDSHVAYPLSVITTVDGSTVEHSIGSVITGIAGTSTEPIPTFGGNTFESFPLMVSADPNTNVIFRAIPRSNPTPFRVTFSGRLIDVP